jgi:hypothetical protein
LLAHPFVLEDGLGGEVGEVDGGAKVAESTLSEGQTASREEGKHSSSEQSEHTGAGANTPPPATFADALEMDFD